MVESLFKVLVDLVYTESLNYRVYYSSLPYSFRSSLPGEMG